MTETKTANRKNINHFFKKKELKVNFAKKKRDKNIIN